MFIPHFDFHFFFVCGSSRPFVNRAGDAGAATGADRSACVGSRGLGGIVAVVLLALVLEDNVDGRPEQVQWRGFLCENSSAVEIGRRWPLDGTCRKSHGRRPFGRRSDGKRKINDVPNCVRAEQTWCFENLRVLLSGNIQRE